MVTVLARCRCCDGAFTRTTDRQEYCGRECKEAVRRLRQRVERVVSKPSRACLHCGARMPGTMRADAAYCSVRFPDPKSPSIDHVVPLAEGGTHDPANLRLTHLGCNARRQARGGNEQLALV